MTPLGNKNVDPLLELSVFSMVVSHSIWVKKIQSSNASPFYQSVWLAMLQIPRGKVSTYGEIARAIGNPRAARAIGGACNQNPFAPDVPCHRIVSSDGKLGGYAHGSAKKIALLKKEGVFVRNGTIERFDSVLHRF